MPTTVKKIFSSRKVVLIITTILIQKVGLTHPCLECVCDMCTSPTDGAVVKFPIGEYPVGAMLSTFVIIGSKNSCPRCATFGEMGFSGCTTPGDAIVGDVTYCCGTMRCGVLGDSSGYAKEPGLRLDVGVDGGFWFISLGCLLGDIGTSFPANC